MTTREAGEPESRSTSAPAPDLWFEILAPVEIAAPLIAQTLETAPALPVGIVIARSPSGSIVLNQRAWSFLHRALTAIQGLRMRHVATAPTENPAIDVAPAASCNVVSSNASDIADASATKSTHPHASTVEGTEPALPSA